MANRVIPAEIRAIKATTLDESVVCTWITLANTIIEGNAFCMPSAETTKKQIELFLAAHFIEQVQPSSASKIKKEKADVLEVEYAMNNVSSTINETTYGYSANMLSKGCLANLDKAKAKVFATGYGYANVE